MTAAGGRLRVDPIVCDGRGLCAEVLPELITLDDWGFPLIRDAEIPPGLMAGAGEAIRLCPLLALRLDRPGPRKTTRERAGLTHPRPPLGGGAGSPAGAAARRNPGLPEHAAAPRRRDLRPLADRPGPG